MAKLGRRHAGDLPRTGGQAAGSDAAGSSGGSDCVGECAVCVEVVDTELKRRAVNGN